MLIHPNFLPNSSRGNSFDEIIENCLKFCPNTKTLDHTDILK